MSPVSEPSDEILMQGVAKGDPSAFERLVLRHQESVWRTAYRMLGCRQTAEDIAQDAFLRIYQAAHRYRPTASFRTYLYRVVVRLCLDCLRRKRPVVSDDFGQLAESGASAEEDALVRERDQAVQAALSRLPAHQRSAIVLRYYEGLSGLEIASAMETSTKAVERLLARGRATLEKRLANLMSD
ncbi:MAG: sigma-70 family RNA polymerase sigma factor [Pirellulaceae bacterium]|nr:sigma-70 family RNA polymerase sigma factor [Pirellulaceae bacterium]